MAAPSPDRSARTTRLPWSNLSYLQAPADGLSELRSHHNNYHQTFENEIGWKNYF